MNVRAGLMILCAVLWGGCSFHDRVEHCQTDSDCNGQRCYEGFCIQSQEGTTASAQRTNSDADAAANTSGDGSAKPGTSATMTGSSKSATGGSTNKDTAGNMQMKPPSKDSGTPGDCSDGADMPCLVDPSSTTTAEGCNRGTQQCISGHWAACVGEPMPADEVCNGLDDDCDGSVDELMQTCYPSGQKGCTQDASGQWSCAGVCATGTRTCHDGQLGDCVGANVPKAEVCTATGDVAHDEDCDQATDERCDCESGQTRRCYNGRVGTMDVGKCTAGSQTCENGALGMCMNEVLPDSETCANPGVDDDCNGMTDDIPSLGTHCAVSGARGPCSSGTLQCVSGQSELSCVAAVKPTDETCNRMDDDCDGKIDETFKLRRDPQNCGMCGHQCTTDEACCAGRCIATQTNDNHCGMCDNKCPSGKLCDGGQCTAVTMPMAGMPAAGAPPTGGMSGSGTGATGGGAAGTAGVAGASAMTCTPACTNGATCCDGACVDTSTNLANCGTCGNACSASNAGCCAGTCVDLQSDAHCGACDRDCSTLSTTAVMCTCSTDANGRTACLGPDRNMCM